jgi:hypothetical protein
VTRLRVALASRPEVRFAYLHGSFAAGGPYRDLDVAVWVDEVVVPRSGWACYAIDLATALGRELMLPVDVQVLNAAPLGFRYHALRGRLLLARDPDEAAEIRARTWDDYLDFAPFARRYLREALRE